MLLPPQALYATLHAVATASGVPVGDALPELYTDGFDVEQVWQQVRCAAVAPCWLGGAGEEDTHNQVADSYPLDDEQHTITTVLSPPQRQQKGEEAAPKLATLCCV